MILTSSKKDLQIVLEYLLDAKWNAVSQRGKEAIYRGRFSGYGGCVVVKRRFWAAVLVLSLILEVALPFGLVSWGFAKVSVAQPSAPSMRDVTGFDVDQNRIDDRLDLEIAQSVSNRSQGGLVNVIVLLGRDVDQAAVDAFAISGGSVSTDLWKYAVYGFGGQIPIGKINGFVNSCSDILLVEKEAECNATLAYAAQQVGARPYVWNTLGLRGDPASSIAVLDTGIDASHVDFAPGYGASDFSKKIVGWNDQVTASTEPFDDDGHGSHCSGLAAGNGFFSVDGSGLAEATWSADLGPIGTGTYLLSGMMVNRTGTITLSVRWANTANGNLNSLSLFYGDKSLVDSTWTQVSSVTTSSENSWYTLSYNVTSVPSGGYDMYHVLGSFTGTRNHLYVMFNMSWPYSPPEDGFSAWTGIAPDSKLVGVKVLDSTGSGTSTGLVNGINWVIANREALHITVASLSLGFSGEVSSVDIAVASLVGSGVCTVVAAGNDGSGSNNIYTPGSVDEVLTVAAMNQFDGVTSYSSQGGTSRYTGQTVKPDITAPGGSFFAVPLFSVDTNYNDAEGRWADNVANDSAPEQGTSMATPIVAGSAQLLVEALGGFAAWNWTRNQALTPKMLLLMTATETYPNARESGTSPTLERGGKDAQEGYGRINVDAAADAVLKSYLPGSTIVGSLGVPPTLGNISVLGQSLCWARNVQLQAGVAYNFSLDVPAGADFDMYLYNITGNAYGEPVVLTKSTTASAGADESVVYTPSLSGEYYIVVKRAREDTGGGQFTLTSGPCSLTVNTVGSGSVTKNPDQTSYALGTLVQLTAVPDSGYSFAGWSGDLSGSTNPASITMNGDKTVTATFNLLPSGGAFDFGTASSPLETGYTQVSNSSVYSPATGYGWSSTIGLDTRDRGSPDDLKRDFVFSSTENTFDVDLADGDYQVTVTIGDQAYGHDLISVYAEDTLVIDSLTTAAGTFQQVTFYVTVSDQQLNLRILDNGGTDPNWVINAVTIEQGSPPSLPTSASFDFGTEGSPVAVGYDQVTESSFYSANVGYGWVTVNGLDSRDRGAPDDLRRDFVFDSSERTFNVDLENGDYLVTVTLGDQNFSHDDIALYAESILEFNNVTTLAGSFQELTFTVNVADEQLNLTILDNGGGDANWVLNAMTVVVAPPPPTSGAFDFGTTDSPVEAGYTQVSQLTLYSAVTGYGWSSTGELDSRDRSAPDDLKRDFVFSSSEHVFSIDLANGNYSVTVTVGDQDYMHDNIDVYAEGILEADNITTAAGSFQQVSFDVAVIDGQLNIGILDNGGVDPYWVVNAIASAIQ